VDLACRDGLAIPLMEAMDVGLPGPLRYPPHLQLPFPDLLGETAILASEGCDGALEILPDGLVETGDLLEPLRGEASAEPPAFLRELHQVLVHDVPDVLQVVDEEGEGKLAPPPLLGQPFLGELCQVPLDCTRCSLRRLARVFRLQCLTHLGRGLGPRRYRGAPGRTGQLGRRSESIFQH